MILVSSGDEAQGVEFGQFLARQGLDVTVVGDDTQPQEIYDLIFGAESLVCFYAPGSVATQIGIALALGKLVYVVGDGDNVFLDMDGIQVCDSEETARQVVLDDHVYDRSDTPGEELSDTADTGGEDE